MTEEKKDQKKESIKEFLESFKLASERKRLGLLAVFDERAEEILELGSSLMYGFEADLCDWAPGFILQFVHKIDENFIKNNLFSYHLRRNYDYGIKNRSNVSHISKYTSHRTINEY